LAQVAEQFAPDGQIRFLPGAGKQLQQFALQPGVIVLVVVVVPPRFVTA